MTTLRMTNIFSLFNKFLLSGALFFFSSIAFVHAELQSSTPLPLGNTFFLEVPFQVSMGTFRPDSETLLVSQKSTPLATKTQIWGFNAKDKLNTHKFSVSHSVLSWDWNKSGDKLFLIGNDDDRKGAISAISLADNSLITVKFAHQFDVPDISAQSKKYLYVSDVSSNAIWSVKYDDLSENDNSFALKKMNARGNIFFGGSLSGPRQIFTSDDEDLLIATDNSRSKVYAVDLGGLNRIQSEAGYTQQKSGLGVPMAMDVGKVLAPDLESEQISLVVGDHQLQSIMLIDYDKDFRNLNLVAIARVGHTFQKSQVVGSIGSSQIVAQPMLVAASKNQRLILSAHTASKDLVQFSRNIKGKKSLEILAKIQLPSFPINLAVSSSGKNGLVLFENSNTAMILSNISTTRTLQVSGRDDVRELQLLLQEIGIRVGTIDGILGRDTRNGIRIASEDFNLKLDPNDISSAVATVKKFKDELK